jgi:hypothetical protein
MPPGTGCVRAAPAAASSRRAGGTRSFLYGVADAESRQGLGWRQRCWRRWADQMPSLRRRSRAHRVGSRAAPRWRWPNLAVGCRRGARGARWRDPPHARSCAWRDRDPRLGAHGHVQHMRACAQSAGLGIRGAPLARAAPAALPRRAARPHSVRMVTQELAEAMQQGVAAGLDPAAIHLAFADQVGPECPRTAASPPPLASKPAHTSADICAPACWAVHALICDLEVEHRAAILPGSSSSFRSFPTWGSSTF